jgi:hypothetical protein
MIFLSGIIVIGKAEIQLIAKKSGPRIRARTSEKNEIIVGLKFCLRRSYSRS